MVDSGRGTGRGTGERALARARVSAIAEGMRGSTVAWSSLVVAALASCAPAHGAAPVVARPLAPDAGGVDADAKAGTDAGTDALDESDDGNAVEDEGVDDARGDDEGDAGADVRVCPDNMVFVRVPEARFCVDRYEASLVEVDGAGNERPYPHWLPVDGHSVRAISVPGVYPQGFISEVQAEDACVASGKRLCTYREWKTACMGPSRTTFPYGMARRAGVCHDSGRSAVAAVFGLKALADPVATQGGGHAGAKGRTAPAGRAPGKKTGVRTTPSRTPHASAPTPKSARGHASRGAKKGAPQPSNKPMPARPSGRPASIEPSVWTQLNDPRLGQVDGALSKTGSHEACVSGYGAFDMMGNLHEWVKTDASSAHGVFAGGYYLDTSINGEGCDYRTTAHAHDYHDYSTGFRCCADALGAE